MSTLADKIDLLFKTFTKPDGREYTYNEVGEGSGVNSSYLWRLRTGKATNPGHRVLAALSEFFQVPPAYFFEEEMEEEYLEDLKLAQRLREEGIDRIALRASGLDEEGKRRILDMIEYIRKARGLDSDSEVNERE